MKLGEGGEAFFVFETTENIPESLQTSPLVSPASSPPLGPEQSDLQLQDPDQFSLDADPKRQFQQLLESDGKPAASRVLQVRPPLIQTCRLSNSGRISTQLVEPTASFGRLVRYFGAASQR